MYKEANKSLKTTKKTVISFNEGFKWSETKIDQDYCLSGPDCSIFIPEFNINEKKDLRWESSGYIIVKGKELSQDHKFLDKIDSNLYISENLGKDWQIFNYDKNFYSSTYNMNFIGLINKSKKSDEIIFSYTMGKTWETLKVFKQPFLISDFFFVDETLDGILISKNIFERKSEIVHLDFNNFFERKCDLDDFEENKKIKDLCINGIFTKFLKKKITASCIIDSSNFMSFRYDGPCKCKINDFCLEKDNLYKYLEKIENSFENSIEIYNLKKREDNKCIMNLSQVSTNEENKISKFKKPDSILIIR